MEELWQLRALIEQGQYAEALLVIGELEAMSKDDKINKIESFFVILLLHLIKKHAENRMTRSWNNSILNAVAMITWTNKRRKAGGYYLTAEELREALEEAWEVALRQAAAEAFEGQYGEQELAQKVDRQQILHEALQYLLQNRN